MFFSKRPAVPAPVPIANRDSGTHRSLPPPTDDSEALIDALGGVLRALAKHAFDVGDTSAKAVETRLEGWARHVLVMAPIPGTEPRDARPDAPRRDYRGLLRAVTDHRRAERDYVTSTISELRAALWSFVSTLTRSLGSDQSTDVRLRERVERLRKAVAGSSYEALRAEAGETASVLAAVVQEREERARRQAMELGKTLRSLREQLDEAHREGALDPLTRVYNRRTLDEVLERAAGLSAIAREPSVLMMVDLDHFKAVNDRHGHQAGDAVLAAVAEALLRCFPRRGDVIARYGGEEFAVVLNGATADDASPLADKLLAALRAVSVKHGNVVLAITASVGYAAIRVGEPVPSWIERADRALYEAKSAGRNRAVAAPV